MSEIMINKYNRLIYIEKFDIIKENKTKKWFGLFFFMFFPKIHLNNCGLFEQEIIELLNTKTGKIREIKVGVEK